MAKNTNTILLVAAAGAAAYFLLQKRGTTKRGEVIVEPLQKTDENFNEIIDATQPGSKIENAIETGKQILATAEDASVLIKTTQGNVALRKGKKRKLAPKFRRKLNPKQRKFVQNFATKFRKSGFGF